MPAASGQLLRSHRWIAIVVFTLLVGSSDADAQSVLLRLSDGTVTLETNAATLGQILEHWARIGNVRIIGTEGLSQSPVTLRLVNVPEAAALAILFRDVSGYILGVRDKAAGGATRIDRIIVLPVSSGASVVANRTITPTTIFDRYVSDGAGGVIMLDSDEPPSVVGAHPETGVSMPPHLIPAGDPLLPYEGEFAPRLPPSAPK